MRLKLRELTILYKLVLLICIIVPWSASAHISSPVKIIFDTDMGGDADDAGALAVAHALMDMGDLEIIAVGVWTHDRHSVGCVSAINNYYGRPDIPIGVRSGGVWDPGSGNYNRAVAENHPHTLTTEIAPNVVDVYRQVLASQPDSSVVIVTVGPLTNIRDLFQSDSDQHSDLNGIDLVRQKVREFVIMGGQFPSGTWEWNFVGGGSGTTKYVVDNCPVPIMFSGFEIGVNIKTGIGLRNVQADNPVKTAYLDFNTNCPSWYTPCTREIQSSSSYDQTAVLYAARGLSNYWNAVTTGYNNVNDDGSNSWVSTNDPNKSHSYLTPLMDNSDLEIVIEELMMKPPEGTVGTISKAVSSKTFSAPEIVPVGNFYRLGFTITQPGRVTASVYDIRGRFVNETEWKNLGAGTHRKTIQRSAAPGAYIAVIRHERAVLGTVRCPL